MFAPRDIDVVLQSLRDEMHEKIIALNALHHPVYPSSPARIAELEATVADLRNQIAARRRDLAAAV